MLRTRRKTCTNHCSSCGMHFHSLAAFDFHLHRINEGKNRWGARSYDLEHSSEGLEVWTDEGYCDLTGADLPLHPVTVWRKPPSDQQKQSLDSLRLAAVEQFPENES